MRVSESIDSLYPRISRISAKKNHDCHCEVGSAGAAEAKQSPTSMGKIASHTSPGGRCQGKPLLRNFAVHKVSVLTNTAGRYGILAMTFVKIRVIRGKKD